MKIGLLGYGKMGRLIQEIAEKEGNSVVGVLQRSKKMDEAEAILTLADVLIDFSDAAAIKEHVKMAISLGKNLVIGTTGWDSQLHEIKKMLHDSGIGCLYSPNFSLGVQIFYEVVRKTAELVHLYGGYAVGGIEAHHNQKRDLPSGTALSLQRLIIDEMGEGSSFTFASVRCGHIPGTHTLLFNSPSDTITLSHEAHSREGFARGALTAAKWLIGKKGLFTLSDLY